MTNQQIVEQDVQDVVLLSYPSQSTALLTLNRPQKRNALDNHTLRQLGELLVKLDTLPQVRAVVITGNDKCFASGADLNELSKMNTVDLGQDERPKLWQKIDEFSKPLICAVNGYALGAGFELVLHTDIVFCGENASLGLPEISLGMLPGAGGTQRLARLIGTQNTMRFAMTAQTITAKQALDYGICCQVTPVALTVQYATELADKIGKQAPLAIKAIKQSVKSIHETTLSQGLKLERQHFVWLSATLDRKEGIDAFLQKRPATFTGQ